MSVRVDHEGCTRFTCALTHEAVCLTVQKSACQLQMHAVQKSLLRVDARQQARMSENVDVRAPDGGRIRTRHHRLAQRLTVDHHQPRTKLAGAPSEWRYGSGRDVRQLDPRDEHEREVIALFSSEREQSGKNILDIGGVHVIGDGYRTVAGRDGTPQVLAR